LGHTIDGSKVPGTTHIPRQAANLPKEEERLLDYVERLARHTVGRRAVHVHISRLQHYNRREQYVRVAFSTLDALTRKFDGGCFQTRTGDLVLIVKGASVAEIDHGVLQLRFLFSEDPLLKDEAPPEDPFCTWYELERDYAGLLALAQSLHTARAIEANPYPTSPEPSFMPDHGPEPMARPGHVLVDRSVETVPRQPAVDLPRLVRVENLLASIDLRELVRRQSAAAIVAQQRPQPLFTQIYVAIGALGRRLLPDVNLFANRWLFQYLTVLLDRRMLRLLPGENNLESQTLALNLNVASVTSDLFLAFDRDIRLKTQRPLIIEIQALDALADLAQFHRAQVFLRTRGHRVLLDGLSCDAFPLLCHPELGCDFYKLHWQTQLIGGVGQRALARLRQQVQAVGPAHVVLAHVVLAHCGEPEAVRFGHDLGIPTFQGHYVDRLLAEPP